MARRRKHSLWSDLEQYRFPSDDPLGGFRGIERVMIVNRVKPGTITYSTADRHAIDRELWYREKYERATVADRGKVVCAFLLDAPPNEWPLANWLFEALLSWKDHMPPIVADDDSETDQHRQAERNIKRVAKVIAHNEWSEPSHRRFLRHVQDHRRVERKSEYLKDAVGLCQRLRQGCIAAKRHARCHLTIGRFDQYVERLKSGRIRFDDGDCGPGPTDFYALLRDAYLRQFLTESEIETFLRRLPTVRPKRSAAFFAGRMFDVSCELVEREAAKAAKRTEPSTKHGPVRPTT